MLNALVWNKMKAFVPTHEHRECVLFEFQSNSEQMTTTAPIEIWMHIYQGKMSDEKLWNKFQPRLHAIGIQILYKLYVRYVQMFDFVCYLRIELISNVSVCVCDTVCYIEIHTQKQIDRK